MPRFWKPVGRRASAQRASEAALGMGGKAERLQPRPTSPDLFSVMTSSPNDPTRTPRSPAHDRTRDDATAAAVVTYCVVLRGSPAVAEAGDRASRTVRTAPGVLDAGRRCLENCERWAVRNNGSWTLGASRSPFPLGPSGEAHMVTNMDKNVIAAADGDH